MFLMAIERWSYLGGSACAYDGVRDYGTGGACHIEREQGREVLDGSM